MWTRTTIRKNLESKLSENQVAYCPNVGIIRTAKSRGFALCVPDKMSFVLSSVGNAGDADFSCLKLKVEWMLHVAAEKGHDVVVIPSWGVSYGLPALQVFSLFKDAIVSSFHNVFTHVVFSVNDEELGQTDLLSLAKSVWIQESSLKQEPPSVGSVVRQREEEYEEEEERKVSVSIKNRKHRASINAENGIMWANQGFVSSREFFTFARSIKTAAQRRPALQKSQALQDISSLMAPRIRGDAEDEDEGSNEEEDRRATLERSEKAIFTKKQKTPLQKQQRQFFDSASVPVEHEEVSDKNEESTIDTSESEHLEAKRPLLVKSERQIFRSREKRVEAAKEPVASAIEIYLTDSPIPYHPTKKQLQKTTRFHPLSSASPGMRRKEAGEAREEREGEKADTDSVPPSTLFQGDHEAKVSKKLEKTVGIKFEKNKK